MENPTRLISIAEIERRSDKSRSYVYAKILPHLECVKVGTSTMATELSFESYIAKLPRVTFGEKASNNADFSPVAA